MNCRSQPSDPDAHAADTGERLLCSSQFFWYSQLTVHLARHKRQASPLAISGQIHPRARSQSVILEWNTWRQSDWKEAAPGRVAAGNLQWNRQTLELRCATATGGGQARPEYSRLGPIKSTIDSCGGPIITDTAQHFPGSIFRSKASNPEENLLVANEDARLDEGGVFKPIESSSEMDSPETADRETPATTMEQQREDHAGSRTPEETTTRRPPNARWDEQEEAKSTDRPRSRKSVA
ncbi:hypothetical protein NDU88_002703 [Pleurodeles waltl]|uniref:Uncharacterized protein n=1 Tax=Pleurodeles waltl TaxID=8319 RepID=A0AAV7KUF4_PLEWA|nr:hypothetical protein NDU88_002703 [Pleurodeles waltl]